MEIWKPVNQIIRIAESVVITLVTMLYILGCYDAVVASGISVRLYFLTTSFYYYITCLVKSPGQLLDFGTANVKGICKKCNRIVGTRTVHCEICNKCYHKRDHHCPIIGRCVASNNTNDLYLTIVFANLYSFAMLFESSPHALMAFVHKYLFVISGWFVFWFTLLIVTDKTTQELLRRRGRVLKDFRVRRLKDVFRAGLLQTLVPYLAHRISVVNDG